MEVQGADAWIETWGYSLLLAAENFKYPGTVGLMLIFYHWGGGALTLKKNISPTVSHACAIFVIQGMASSS